MWKCVDCFKKLLLDNYFWFSTISVYAILSVRCYNSSYNYEADYMKEIGSLPDLIKSKIVPALDLVKE